MCFFFFFKQKTAYEMRISDWSSDVCSSDRRPAALYRRIASEQALRRILVETRIRRVNQDHSRHRCQNRKGRGEIECPVKDLQLARSGGRVCKRSVDRGGRRRNLRQQEQADEN